MTFKETVKLSVACSVMQIHNNGCVCVFAHVGSMEHKSKQRSFHRGRPFILGYHEKILFSFFATFWYGSNGQREFSWVCFDFKEGTCLLGTQLDVSSQQQLCRHKCVFLLVSSLMWLPGKREETSSAKFCLEIWEWKHWPKHLPWVWLSVGLFGPCVCASNAMQTANMTFKVL